MNVIKKQLNFTLNEFELGHNMEGHYRGKVRDNYYFGDRMLMVTTDDTVVEDKITRLLKKYE